MSHHQPLQMRITKNKFDNEEAHAAKACQWIFVTNWVCTRRDCTAQLSILGNFVCWLLSKCLNQDTLLSTPSPRAHPNVTSPNEMRNRLYEWGNLGLKTVPSKLWSIDPITDPIIIYFKFHKPRDYSDFPFVLSALLPSFFLPSTKFYRTPQGP